LGKSIVVFCDDTGQGGITTSSATGQTQVSIEELERANAPALSYPTNVLRLSRCIPPRAMIEPRRQQLVFYQSGVGATSDFRGAATGGKIRDAYNFIAQNYEDGDRIYLFGCGRGAYTARKVAELICRVGLLDRRQMGNFFRYWSALDRNDSTVEIRVGKVASIHFIGVWDTVGSIYAELTTPKLNALSLADTELPHGIGIARHALAYHENRTEFFPTPYVGYDESRDVQQVWFPGGNLDVGGGYSDHLTADLALCWMAGEAHNAGLILEEAFLYDCFVLLDSPDAQLELRLHLGGRDLLAVGHLKMLANLPNRDKTVILPASNPNYMYHQSLWAEIRLASDGPSCKAFDGKAGEPAKKTLTDFEQKYWTMCGWDKLLPNDRELRLRKSIPAPRYQAPSQSPPSQEQAPITTPEHDIQLERDQEISSLLSAREIVSILATHGCENITSRLDQSSCSSFALFSGGFGDVYRGRLYNGVRVAIKAMRMQILSSEEDAKPLKDAARELYTWSKCAHPNVLGLLGVVEFRDQIGMVAEWMENGNLPLYIKLRPSVNRCRLSTQICDGLSYLHGIGIVHGDVKGLNVLIANNGDAMLVAFGNAVLTERTLQFTTTGTSKNAISQRWAAPELFQGTSGYSIAADVYALGMTILETITGNVPYASKNDLAIPIAVAVKKELPPRPEDYIPSNSPQGDTLWSLLVECWAYDSNNRPIAANVGNIMRTITQKGLMRKSTGATD
ncbi:hypothetical protein FRC12_017464, partial [Ceratobasidium sp. 428]